MLALLYDIHGNLPALEAVLADARHAGANKFLLGGDMVAFGPDPAGTLARLRELDGVVCIRGNTERWLIDRNDTPELMHAAMDACHAEIGDDAVRRLAALPESARVGDAVAFHASPVSDMRSFLPEPAADEDELLDGLGDRQLIFGHTHLQFAREHSSDLLMVNPGSVGIPLDGDPRAAYALLHADGGFDLCRVEYDHAAAAATVRERFGGAPWAEVVAGRIERARFDG
jgi:predicted phosphodiesterase